MLIRPALEAAYAIELPTARMPAIEATFTIAPSPASFIAGATALVQKNGPFRFTARIRSQCSSAMPSRSAKFTNAVVAALFTRMSTEPNASSA